MVGTVTDIHPVSDHFPLTTHKQVLAQTGTTGAFRTTVLRRHDSSLNEMSGCEISCLLKQVF